MCDWIPPFGAELPCQIFWFSLRANEEAAVCWLPGWLYCGAFIGTFIPVPIPTVEFRRWDQDEKQILKPYTKGCNT